MPLDVEELERVFDAVRQRLCVANQDGSLETLLKQMGLDTSSMGMTSIERMKLGTVTSSCWEIRGLRYAIFKAWLRTSESQRNESVFWISMRRRNMTFRFGNIARRLRRFSVAHSHTRGRAWEMLQAWLWRWRQAKGIRRSNECRARLVSS